MQIEIYKPLTGDKVPPVEWNYEELKQWLTDGLALYKGRVYDAGQISEAKKDAADLRKLAAAIDGKRKDMKKQYLKPYEEFETQAKELTGLINEQVDEIAAQIRAYDEGVKGAKRAEIEALYADSFGSLAELVPFDRLFNARWLNVTFKMGQVETELKIRKAAIESALAAIRELELEPDVEQQVTHVYLETFELSRALAAKAQIEQERRRLAEYAAAQGRKVYDASDPDAFKKAQPGDIVHFGGPACASTQTEPQSEPVYTVDFRVLATAAQLAGLKKYMKDNGIEYGRVPKN